MNILTIDSSRNEKIVIGLRINDKLDIIEKKLTNHRDQIILPLILEILKKNNLTIADLTEIEVATGPGSYTGLRVGVAIANALSYGLQIPVNGKEFKENSPLIVPIYS